MTQANQSGLKPDDEVRMRTLVLGLGNPILSDDGVGIVVARAAAERYQQLTPDERPAGEAVEFAEASVGGLRLLEVIAGYDRVIMIDAIQTASGEPGDVYCIGPDAIRTSLHTDSTHDLSLPNALDLGRGLGMSLPEDEEIIIFAVETADVITFSESCTPAVQASVPELVGIVLAEISRQMPASDRALGQPPAARETT